MFARFSGYNWTYPDIATRTVREKGDGGKGLRRLCVVSYLHHVGNSTPLMGWMKPSHAIPCMLIHNGTIAASDANVEVMDCLLTNLTQSLKALCNPKMRGCELRTVRSGWDLLSTSKEMQCRPFKCNAIG